MPADAGILRSGVLSDVSSAEAARDQKPFAFATKALTLERLYGRVTRGKFCEQIIVTAENWRQERAQAVDQIIERFASSPLAVRSSAANEDRLDESNAGAHLSQTNVAADRRALIEAIDAVFASYSVSTDEDQVLVQPMVSDVAISGVLLTRDLDTGSPYFVINYDDFSGRTDTVTGGAESKTIFIHRSRPDAVHSSRFRKLVDCVIEIELVTGSEHLDVEFCITSQEDIYILQVRPLAARGRWHPVGDERVDQALARARGAIAELTRSRQGLAGGTTILGEMPDWNPAEMIGNTPRPLAHSLYRNLITDRVWSLARSQMGYRDVPHPLMVAIEGRPYIDVRLSLNSFLPKDIDEGLAGRLVDWQLNRLAEHPEYHDKIEFNVAVTCRDFAFESVRRSLIEDGFSPSEASTFETELTKLTWKALSGGSAALSGELAATGRLASTDSGERRRATENLHAALERCRVFGTLPFAKLARHGFIGVLLLRSLVVCGILSNDDADRFMRSIETVATEFVVDMERLGSGALSERVFLERYGHLRPGTYDITSWRYDEMPELYLSGVRVAGVSDDEPFRMTPSQQAATDAILREAGFDLTHVALLDYIRAAVRAREQAKFAFTRTLSSILSDLAKWGEDNGLTREDVSFLPIDVALKMADRGALRDAVSAEREKYALTRGLRLPYLILEPDDIDVVRLPLGQPNFITGNAVTAPIRLLDSRTPGEIDGCIVLIENADPGFDWIFCRDIKGLITKYGGANSHMAIRSAEFGLPAAIGCGERLFNQIAAASVVELDCAARKIHCH